MGQRPTSRQRWTARTRGQLLVPELRKTRCRINLCAASVPPVFVQRVRGTGKQQDHRRNDPRPDDRQQPQGACLPSASIRQMLNTAFGIPGPISESSTREFRVIAHSVACPVVSTLGTNVGERYEGTRLNLHAAMLLTLHANGAWRQGRDYFLRRSRLRAPRAFPLRSDSIALAGISKKHPRN